MTQWKECPGFSDYEISEIGDIRRRKSGRALKPFVSFGYLKYSLRRDGIQFNVFAHRLVTEAFIGPPPFALAMSCHNDGTRNSNHYSNLRWDTAKGNAADMVAHGTRISGERAAALHKRVGSKLTAEQVIQIRALIASGESQVSIGPRFNIAGQTVSKIARRETWAHIV